MPDIILAVKLIMTPLRAYLQPRWFWFLVMKLCPQSYAQFGAWFWELPRRCLMKLYWSMMDQHMRVSFCLFTFHIQNLVTPRPKVIKILGIRKTWSLLGTISNVSLPYTEHTRLCLVWLLQWGFWWIWHFGLTLRFKNTIKSEQNLWK